MTEHSVEDEDLVALVAPLSALTTQLGKVLARKPLANRLALLQAVAYADGQARPSTLAEALNLHQSQVTRAVQALEDEDLVTVRIDPSDARSRRLSVTPDGTREIERLTGIGLARWRRFVDGWDPADVRELGRLLSRLDASITEANHRGPRRNP